MNPERSLFVQAPVLRTTARDTAHRRLELATPPADATSAAPRAAGTTPPPVALAARLDDALIAVLDAPLQPGETTHAGYARKEHELGNQFAKLGVTDARTMHARLSNPKPDDMLAQKFARMTVDRRSRLLAFLADVRRREAMRGSSPFVLRCTQR